MKKTFCNCTGYHYIDGLWWKDRCYIGLIRYMDIRKIR